MASKKFSVEKIVLRVCPGRGSAPPPPHKKYLDSLGFTWIFVIGALTLRHFGTTQAGQAGTNDGEAHRTLQLDFRLLFPFYGQPSLHN